MSEGLPQLFADDGGIWIEESRQPRSGIFWDEVVAVGGYKLDIKPAILTVIELEHPSGHWLELHSHWGGFSSVAAAMTAHLPGMPRDWLESILKLQPYEAAITVWRRSRSH